MPRAFFLSFVEGDSAPRVRSAALKQQEIKAAILAYFLNVRSTSDQRINNVRERANNAQGSARVFGGTPDGKPQQTWMMLRLPL